MPPSLFAFAPSELSQDAFLCWLLSWADPKYATVDPGLHRAGTDLIAALLDKCDIPVPTAITSLDIKRQFNKIDILVLVNNSIAILIEDKTKLNEHSDQLTRYREVAETHFANHKLAPIYFKTGDQSSYAAIESDGYRCFLRADLLEVLGRERGTPIRNDIFDDFHCHLTNLERRVTDYLRKPLGEWHYDCWTGFLIDLRKRLGDGGWGYVPNQKKGFMGFWWHTKDGCYLQLENGTRSGDDPTLWEDVKLRFKIVEKDPARQAASWESWHARLMREAARSSFPIRRPKRRASGQWMTVAALVPDDYRRAGSDGLIDMVRTVDVLRSVEAFLDRAAAEEGQPETGRDAKSWKTIRG